MSEPWMTALVDQAQAAVRDVRADGPAAETEVRCTAPPVGCGQRLATGRLATAFRDQRSRDEYEITHLCQSCQDAMGPAPTPAEIAAMEADDRYERCPVCGEYRELEFVDVGVGVMSGHDCCAHVRFYGQPHPGYCGKTDGCEFAAGHVHGCESRHQSGPVDATEPEF